MMPFKILTFLLLCCATGFAQTPISEADLPKSENPNIIGMDSNAMIHLLNKGLMYKGDSIQKTGRLEVFLLNGAAVNGEIKMVKVETLGIKVDSVIINALVRAMKAGYPDLLKQKGQVIDHEFSYVFNFDFEHNQVYNDLSCLTWALRKNWEYHYRY